mgnify:CR=1 FL=1
MEFRLILKKIDNSLNAEERKTFDAWYSESEAHRIYFNRVQENYTKGLDVFDIEQGWDKVSSKTRNRRKKFFHLKSAAAITILVTTGFIWFTSTETTEKQILEDTPVVEQSAIEIGSDKAVLTLEDGSKITLGKGETFKTDKASSNGEQLIYNGIQKPSENTITTNTLTTPRGGQFFIVLADGTKVWTNSETQLKYPVSFNANKTREVELIYGEAYFEVSPSMENNGTHFIVKAEGQEVDVLGTEFNIKAYIGDDHVYTTLVEGKVLIKHGNDSKNLTPGHQSRLQPGSNELVINEVDVYEEISWKDGLFSFKNRSLEDIMTVLSRWYDVDVVFHNDALKKIKFNGVFRKSLQIDEILDIIKNTNEVNYEINGKTITMK